MAARSRSRTLDTACSSHLPTRFNSYGPSLLHGPAMHGVAERQRWNFVLPRGRCREASRWNSLGAPLRIFLYSDAFDRAVISMDRPSSVMSSLEVAAVSTVGRELDQIVLALPDSVGVRM